MLSWQVDFARPLWLAVLAGLPIWLVFWRRSLLKLSAGRKVVAVVLRALLLAAVAVGLAGPAASAPSSEKFVAVARSERPRAVAPPRVELTAPDHVRAGEPFTLDLLLRSDSTSTATVEVLRDEKRLQEQSVPLVAGENRKSIPAMVEKPGRVVFLVKLPGMADGTRSVPATSAACPIYVDPPPRVLIVEGQPKSAEHLAKALAGEHIEVEVRPELPGGAAFGQYDLIILSNEPADAISKSRMAELQSYVRDGGGLIAVGGDHSFTVGGYRHTPLDDMLPVISESHSTRPKPTLAMVLVLDISGSMNDPVSKGAKERNIDLAKEALRRAVGMLGPRDQVGVLVFEDASRWIWPLGPVTDKAKIIAKIDTIEAEGETNMYPPLEKAYLALRESFADVKHVIVSTDGIGNPGDFDGLARKMAAAGITMSTVGVGSEPVRPFMQKLADLAKGRAYFCENGKAIPQIFAAETGAAARIGITEGPFFPQVVHDSDALRGLDMAKAPTLLGYAETMPRAGANVVLAAKTGEPILAMQHFGRGTTAAFTSDVQSRWAAPWLNWPGFSRFWAQLARATMRRELPPTSHLTADAADGRLYLTLDAEDREGRFINSADVSATVEPDPKIIAFRSAKDGQLSQSLGQKSSTLSMNQIAPGRYLAAKPADTGVYWLSAEIRRDGDQLDKVRGAAAVLSMPETVLKLDGSVETAEKPGFRTAFLWPWLLGAAAVLLVLDLAVRRTAKPIAM